MASQFYQKILMDHYKNPRNKKSIKNPDFSSGHDNPSCGDKVSISGKIENGIVIDIGFDGSGCVISMAAASLLTEQCKGKSVIELLALSKEDILKMIGLELGPNRLHCALLSLEALHKAFAKYEEK